MWLRQSTASQEIQLGKFVDDTDGKTAETALSIANTDIKLWKEGATTQANKNSGGATHIANGHYYTVLDATDTNTLGKLEVTVDVTGALSVRREFMVVPSMVYDALILGTDVLQTDVTQFNGTNGTFSSGRPEVNTTHWSGTAVGSATVRSDVINIAGAAVNTSSAQLGVNVVNAAGTAWGSGAITAASIAASALNDKGNWNVGKTGYSLTATTGLGNQTADITGNLSGSVGSVSGNVGGISGITFPTGFSTLTSGSIASDVWSAGTRTLTSNGNDITAADVWNYGTRTLTSGGGSLTAADVWSYSGRSLDSGVTVTTNNDKTGYSLTQAFPTNFDVLAISPTTGKVTVGTNDDKTGYSLTAGTITSIQSGLATSAALTTVEGKIDTIDGIVDSILVDTAEIGVAGAGLTALAPASTALSTANWTNTRAGYLDKLNITGNVASSAEVTSIQNNTRIVFIVPEQIERPTSGTKTFYIRLYLYDSVGNMEAPDSAPTMALANVTGTDLSARLNSTTGTLESTGVYRWTYTSSSGDTAEQLLWTVTIVEGGVTRLNGRSSYITDSYAVDFTSSDRTTLNNISTYVDDLESRLTSTRAGYLDNLTNLDVAITSRLATASYTAPDNASITAIKAKTDNLPTDPADQSLIEAAITAATSPLATAAALAVVDDFLDTEVAAIKAKTDNLPASPAAVGSAMTLANGAVTTAAIADGAITDAKFTFPSETSGRPSTFMAWVRRIGEWTFNKRTRNRSDGTVTLRNANDDGTLETQTQSTSGTVDTQTKGV
jgi:hypothetical protein